MGAKAPKKGIMPIETYKSFDISIMYHLNGKEYFIIGLDKGEDYEIGSTKHKSVKSAKKAIDRGDYV